MTTSLHHSGITGKGIESVYFSNGDKTGWKTFLDYGEVEQSAKIQGWLNKHNLAPKVLSEIIEIEIIGSIMINPYSFKCPVSGVNLHYIKSKNILEFFDGKSCKYRHANCLEQLKEVKATVWGYLTEEVPIIARGLKLEKHKEYYRKLLDNLEEIEMEGSMDLHDGNWGVLNNNPVVLDCGKHFINESYKCNDELYELIYGKKKEKDYV